MKYKFTQKDEAIYLDWRNNFLTIRNFADHYNFTANYASALINHFRDKTKRVYKIKGDKNARI